MKKPPRGFWIVIVVLFLAVIGLVGYGLAEPRSPVGHMVFHIGYSFPPTRPAFLSFYQWALRMGEGGYLPSSVDQFLTNKLWECEGSREFEAIIDFHIRQRSGRWGEAPSQAPESLRVKIIDSVMKRLDTMPTSEAVSAMEFVESLRRGSSLQKGGFSGMYSWDESGKYFRLKEERFELAKTHFKSWWMDSQSRPEARLAIDPLSETNLSIHDGP